MIIDILNKKSIQDMIDTKFNQLMKMLVHLEHRLDLMDRRLHDTEKMVMDAWSKPQKAK